MITKCWKELIAGLLLLALTPGGAVANPLDPATEAAVIAGDVDAVAAVLANMASTGGTRTLSTTMEEVARLNPDIAGAVVNATVRNLNSSGVGSGSLGPAVRTLVAGAMSGVGGMVAAEDATTYAENIATNVRQAIGAVSGGDQGTENALLASARSGVSQSMAGQTGTSATILRSDVSVRLQPAIDNEESEEAVDAEPIVVVHVDAPAQQNQGDDQGQQGQQGGDQGQQGQQDGNQGQQPSQQGQPGDPNPQGQQPPQQGRPGDPNPQGNRGPIVPPNDPAVEEQPQIDVGNASPF